MALLELPHSSNCLVCGRSNPHGLKLSLHVDDKSGEVRCSFTPTQDHVGFDGIIHGGLLATVFDEAMVWAATWRGRKFCVCAELSVRFRQPAVVGVPLMIVAIVEFQRPKLIETSAKLFDDAGFKLMATAGGKYMPVAPEQHLAFLNTMLREPKTEPALIALSEKK